MRPTGAIAWIPLATLAAACGSGAPDGASDAVQRGREVYANVCVACHHGDPKQAGSLGPPVAGSSRELLEAKVLHGSYPPGYTPQRNTHTMPPYTYLADSIDDLAAYLAAAGR